VPRVTPSRVHCPTRVKQNHRATAAFTLLEMLLVIGIIGILAAMLLGAVNKAFMSSQNKVWRAQAYDFYDYMQEHLAKYYQANTNYPVLTARDLYQQNVFNDRIMNFLRCPHVQYIPFSLSDPTNKVIFQIDSDWMNNQKSVPGHTNYWVIVKQSVARH
jgi:prepilin-type N-terminal cleavage/methylation domain-containing protein